MDLNRELLIEGNSLIITLTKNINDEENRFKRINVKKIVGMKNLLNRPINHVKFNLKDVNKLEELSQKLINKDELAFILFLIFISSLIFLLHRSIEFLFLEY